MYYEDNKEKWILNSNEKLQSEYIKPNEKILLNGQVFGKCTKSQKKKNDFRLIVEKSLMSFTQQCRTYK